MTTRLRLSEYVPPLPEHDMRVLRGLPTTWSQAVAESAIDALRERGAALASVLVARGRPRDAADLRRRVALLERADELHMHAASVETAAQLYRALLSFAKKDESKQEASFEASRVWLQAGALPGQLASAHGPAFRKTAALRSRAFRWLEQAIAKYTRLR
jgi:hypothetical protein